MGITVGVTRSNIEVPLASRMGCKGNFLVRANMLIYKLVYGSYIQRKNKE